MILGFIMSLLMLYDPGPTGCFKLDLTVFCFLPKDPNGAYA